MSALDARRTAVWRHALGMVVIQKDVDGAGRGEYK